MKHMSTHCLLEERGNYVIMAQTLRRLPLMLTHKCHLMTWMMCIQASRMQKIM